MNWGSLVADRRTRYRKVASSNPGRSGGKIFLIRCPFHLHVTTVSRERPRSFCQKCRLQVTAKHAYTLDPTKSEWADYAAVQAWCGNLSGNELTRNLSKPGAGQNNINNTNSVAWSTYCREFYHSNFCLPGPFSFIFSNPLRAKNCLRRNGESDFDLCCVEWLLALI